MSPLPRSYQGRHRALPVSPWQSARVAFPALAAASLTVAAASTAAGGTSTGQATGDVAAGVKDTTQLQRQHQGTKVSRSVERTSAADARAAAATKAAAAKAAKAKAAKTTAAAARTEAARSSALAAVRAPSQQMAGFTPSRSTGTAEAASAPATSAPGSTTASTAVSRSTTRASSDTSSTGWVRAAKGGTFTSGFGSRWGKLHAGLDYGMPVGTPLRSMGGGVVEKAGWDSGLGYHVVIRYASGVESVYGHMSRLAATPGQQVSPGTVVGYSGNTGHSTGPHLHLEIHIGGVPINPMGWLSARGLF